MAVPCRMIAGALVALLALPPAAQAQEKKPLSTKEIAWMSVAVGAAAVIAILAHRDAARALAAEPCDGQPNWCFTFRSQAQVETEVFIDGKSVGRVGVRKQLRVPWPAGGSVFINHCWQHFEGGIFDTGSKLCSDPKTFEMDRNWTYLIYPFRAGM